MKQFQPNVQDQWRTKQKKNIYMKTEKIEDKVNEIRKKAPFSRKFMSQRSNWRYGDIANEKQMHFCLFLCFCNK